MAVRGVESAAANRGRICAKGAQLGPTVRTPDRLAYPLVRRSRRDEFRAVDWAAALDFLAERFTDLLLEHGQRPRATYAFRHALIQDAAYRSVLRRTRTATPSLRARHSGP